MKEALERVIKNLLHLKALIEVDKDTQDPKGCRKNLRRYTHWLKNNLSYQLESINSNGKSGPLLKNIEQYFSEWSNSVKEASGFITAAEKYYLAKITREDIDLIIRDSIARNARENSEEEEPTPSNEVNRKATKQKAPDLEALLFDIANIAPIRIEFPPKMNIEPPADLGDRYRRFAKALQELQSGLKRCQITLSDNKSYNKAIMTADLQQLIDNFQTALARLDFKLEETYTSVGIYQKWGQQVQDYIHSLVESTQAENPNSQVSTNQARSFFASPANTFTAKKPYNMVIQQLYTTLELLRNIDGEKTLTEKLANLLAIQLRQLESYQSLSNDSMASIRSVLDEIMQLPLPNNGTAQEKIKTINKEVSTCLLDMCSYASPKDSPQPSGVSSK